MNVKPFEETNYIKLCGRITFYLDNETNVYWGASVSPDTSFLLVPRSALAQSDQEILACLRNKEPLIDECRAEQIVELILQCGISPEKTIPELEEWQTILGRFMTGEDPDPEYQEAYKIIQQAIVKILARPIEKARIKAARVEISRTYNELFMRLGRQYGFHCLRCASTHDLEIDHVVPLIAGGTSAYENLQLLCATHNSEKRAQSIDYRPSSKTEQSGASNVS